MGFRGGILETDLSVDQRQTLLARQAPQ